MRTKKTPSKVVNLDEKDRAILRLELKDPRIPVADIARELGVQRDTVLYRLKRLETRGLIKKYHVILSVSALGLTSFMMLLIKLSPVRKEAVDAFIDTLVAHPNVTHISRLVGRYDYLVQIAAEDIVAFDAVLDEIKTQHHDVIADIDISSVIDGPKIDDFSGLV